MKKIISFLLLFTTYLFSCFHYTHYPYYYKDMEITFVPEDEKNPLFQSYTIYEVSSDKVFPYYAKIKKEFNLKEWAKYLKVSKEEAESIIYESMAEREDLKKYLALTNKINSLLNSYYDEKLVKENIFLIKEAKKGYEDEKDKFLKLRYAYQYIRVLHFYKEYHKEIEFIDSIRGLQKDSIVWEWIDSYYAGAYKKLKNYAKSSYLDALIFMHHKSDPYIGFYDYKITTDKEWDELLKMAKNDEERIVFHYLNAKESERADLLELIQMSKINPNSIWVKRLTQSIAFKVEEDYCEDCEDCEDDEKDCKEAKRYNEDFINYLKKYRDYNNNEYLYAYLSLLYHSKLIHIKDRAKDEMLAFMKYIKDLKSFDEDEVSRRLELVKDVIGNDKRLVESLEGWTVKKIKKFYKCEDPKRILAESLSDSEWGDPVTVINQDINLKIYKAYKSLEDKENKNLLDKYFLSVANKPFSKDKERLILALGYTARGEFKKALKELKKLPKSYRRVSHFNPFNVNINLDNRKYDNRGREVRIKHPYTHERLLKTIMKLDLSKAQDNFLLANAWYNISFFGNSPMLSIVYKHVDWLECFTIKDAKYQLDMARKYYKKAISLSDDKEFKAKVEFQLLKVEYSYDFVTKHKDDFVPEFGLNDFDYKKNKNMVKEFMQKNRAFLKQLERFKEYEDTNFYKNVVKNCATFSYFK